MKPLLLALYLLLLLSSCGGSNTSLDTEGRNVELRYARYLTMEEHDGFTLVRIKNPWDTAGLLHSYLLLERGVPTPSSFPDADIINVPLENSIVYSSVHNSLVSELGAIDAVSGVCDAGYISDTDIKKRLESGKIADCGDSMSPNIEIVLSLSPGAVLLSPYENSRNYGKLGHAGIPIVECADYMEVSPLARAEWMKFYGRLYGREEVADSLFEVTERQYLDLKKLAAGVADKPKVITDRVYGQVWNVPGGKSTMGMMIEDAGGENVFGGNNVSGSLQLSPEKVLYDGKDADIWLIRFYGTPLSLESLAGEKELYSKFKAFRNGMVFGSDSSVSNVFEDQAFHPQWILADLISIFHPELSVPDHTHRYYEKLDR